MLTLDDCKRCVANKQDGGSMIDLINPETGRTLYSRQTVEEIRERYPNAEEMGFDEYCDWKSAEQAAIPIEWKETTEDDYDDMLCALPPAYRYGGLFLVGEPTTHCAATGQPRFSAYRKNGDLFEYCSKPLTIAEAKEIATK